MSNCIVRHTKTSEREHVWDCVRHGCRTIVSFSDTATRREMANTLRYARRVRVPGLCLFIERGRSG